MASPTDLTAIRATFLREVPFSIIKVNIFGMKQQRRVIVEHPPPGGPGNGRIKIETSAGESRRIVVIADVAGVERVPQPKNSTPAAAAEVARSVCFRFRSAGEASRTLIFLNVEERDAFLYEVEHLAPRIVKRRLDGTLGSTEDALEDEKRIKRIIVARLENAIAVAAKRARPVAPFGDFFSATGLPRVMRENDGIEDADVSRWLENAVISKHQESAGGRSATAEPLFYALLENARGSCEPFAFKLREGLISEDGSPPQHPALALGCATASAENFLELISLESVSARIHADDGLTLQLSVGDKRTLTFTFNESDVRSQFLERVRRSLPSIVVDDSWRGALPVRRVYRFDVVHIRPKRSPSVILLDATAGQFRLLRGKDIAGYAASLAREGSIATEDVIIPETVRVREVFDVSAHKFVVQRSTASPRVASVAFGECAQTPSTRTWLEFEFPSVAERERFVALSTAVVAGGAREGAASVDEAASALRGRLVLWTAPTVVDNMRIFAATFNVGGAGPPPLESKELDAWIPSPVRSAAVPDLYVISLQECGGQRDAWGTALSAHLGGSRSGLQFTLVDQISMWEMAMWIFVREEHASEISGVSHAARATGIGLANMVTGTRLGNKGGVGIALRWRETTLAFVAVHLPAKKTRVQKRHESMKKIARKLLLESLPLSSHCVDVLNGADHVWVLGDLNYRVSLPWDRVVELYKEKQFQEIAAFDTFAAEQGRKRVLHRFAELRPLPFAPSYRWERNMEEFSNKHLQVPSFTDRILHRSVPGEAGALTQTSYESATFFFRSDHRPVMSVFTLALPRPFSPPAPPRVAVPFPVPTFFSALDAPRMTVPLFAFLGPLRASRVSALAAPRSLSVTLFAPWLESPVPLGSATAIGLSDAQFSELRALRTEVIEEKKREKAAQKATQREEQIRERRESRDATARGASPATVQDRTSSSSPEPREWGGAPSSPLPVRPSTPSTPTHGGGIGASADSPVPPHRTGASADSPVPPHRRASEMPFDEDDDAEHDMDEASDDDGDHHWLYSDAESSDAGGRSSDLSSSALSRRAELLALTVSYEWHGAASGAAALALLKPIIWHPSALAAAHVHLVFHDAGDGLAIEGGGSPRVSATVGGGAAAASLFGVSVVEMRSAVRAAAAAVVAAGADEGVTVMAGDVPASPPIFFSVDIEFGGVPRGSASGRHTVRASNDETPFPEPPSPTRSPIFAARSPSVSAKLALESPAARLSPSPLNIPAAPAPIEEIETPPVAAPSLSPPLPTLPPPPPPPPSSTKLPPPPPLPAGRALGIIDSSRFEKPSVIIKRQNSGIGELMAAAATAAAAPVATPPPAKTPQPPPKQLTPSPPPPKPLAPSPPPAPVLAPPRPPPAPTFKAPPP